MKILFYFLEPSYFVHGAAKAIQGPLLRILFKNEKNENDKISINVIEIAMSRNLPRRMVYASPEEIER